MSSSTYSSRSKGSTCGSSCACVDHVREIERELFESDRAQAEGRIVAAGSRRHATPAAD